MKPKVDAVACKALEVMGFLYHQPAAECLAHSRCSTNACSFEGTKGPQGAADSSSGAQPITSHATHVPNSSHTGARKPTDHLGSLLTVLWGGPEARAGRALTVVLGESGRGLEPGPWQVQCSICMFDLVLQPVSSCATLRSQSLDTRPENSVSHSQPDSPSQLGIQLPRKDERRNGTR